MAEFAHNSWKYKHTKHSLHKLIIGINPSASISTLENTVSATQDCVKMLQQSRTDAQKVLIKNIKPLNSPRTFVPGNKVWLDARNLPIKTQSRKLSPQRYGPYEIMKQISPVTYYIKLPASLKMHNVFHVDLLIPHHKTDAYGEQYSQPPPELIDGQEEYIIEEILDDQINKQNRKKQYYVSWQGYPASKNQWVNTKNLYAPELLAEYHHTKRSSAL